jgi:hypothetical protein
VPFDLRNVDTGMPNRCSGALVDCAFGVSTRGSRANADRRWSAMLILLVCEVNAPLMVCVPLLFSLRKVLRDKRHPRSELVCVVAEHPLHAFELI